MDTKEIKQIADDTLEKLCKEFNLPEEVHMRAAFEVFRNEMVFRVRNRELGKEIAAGLTAGMRRLM